MFNILHQPLESNFDQASFPAELRANMEKIRDLDEFVETEKARATSLREVSLTRDALGTKFQGELWIIVLIHRYFILMTFTEQI